MPGNFPLVELRNFDSWIPTTDIDGIDAQPNVLADVSSMDFENGYIQNTFGASTASLPANVSTQITGGYNILSAKKFDIYYTGAVHTHTLFVMYLSSSDNRLKIYVDDTLVKIDGTNDYIVTTGTPEHINYSFANNSLKVNLNCTGIMDSIIGDPLTILNLSLVYIETIREYGLSPATIIGKEFWSLQPRWIGGSYQTYPDKKTLQVQAGGLTVGSVKDTNYTLAVSRETGRGSSEILTIGNLSYYARSYLTGTLGVGRAFQQRTGEFFQKTGQYDLVSYNPSTTYTERSEIWIYKPTTYDGYWNPIGSSIRDIYKLKFNIGCTRDDLWATEAKMQYYVKIYDESTLGIEFGAPLLFSYGSDTISRLGEDIEIDVNLLGDSASSYTIEIVCIIPVAGTSVNCYGFIKSFEIVPHSLALVVRTNDGQRGLLQDTDNNITNDLMMAFFAEHIDWRVIEYEIYAEYNGIYYLSKSYKTNELTVVIADNVIRHIIGLTELTSTTLNYNYNLPYDKRVDNQRNIYSEVTHKGRIYFVNEDEKVYQSHISANGVTQPDAFPYDEDTGFGYFIVNRDKQNKALAVTPDNNLGIFTASSFYVYFIQASNGGAYKQLKLISGSVGISSINSIIRTLNGEPSTDGLFWCDRNGVYVYFGGVDPPINLIVPTHENYWAAISDIDKDAVVMFYNVKDREIWINFSLSKFPLANIETIIYEIPYKKWKKRAVTNTVQEYCGMDDGIIYYRYNDLVYKYDYVTRVFGRVTTHKTTPNVEDYWNILQEVYVVIDEITDGALEVVLIVNVVCAGFVYSQSYTLNTNTRFHKILAPLGFRFNSIYFDLLLNSVNLIRVKSLRYTYSEDNNEMLGQNVVHTYEHGFGVEPFGEEFGS